MSTRDLLDHAWDWQLFGDRWRLHIARPGGDRYASLILQGENGSGILTRDLESNAQRLIVPSDDIAKIIAAAPDVRRHAQSLINGINIGLVRIETDADETTANVLTSLREALARSGAG